MIASRSTSERDWVRTIGGKAQAVESGIIVGSRPPNRDRLVDNTLLRNHRGELYPGWRIALTILHETAHIVHRHGTIGFWNGVAYFAEAIFLLRAAHHSAERRPRATSGEFVYFYLAEKNPAVDRETVASLMQEHYSESHSDCEHGPFDEAPAQPPLAGE